MTKKDTARREEEVGTDDADVKIRDTMMGLVADGWVAATVADGAADGRLGERWTGESRMAGSMEEGELTEAGSGIKEEKVVGVVASSKTLTEDGTGVQKQKRSSQDKGACARADSQGRCLKRQ